MEFDPQDRGEPGKEASNLVVLISELYNLQVIGCILIYDLVRELLNQPQLSEYNVELLLRIVKSKHYHPLHYSFTEHSKILGCSSDKMIHLR